MLTVNQPVAELGEVKFGKPHRFTYELTNSGDSAISIIKLIPGCGSCTTAECNKGYLSPKETATLKATFTPGSTGMQTKIINVVYKHPTSDVTEKTLQLKFKAIVNE